MDNLRSQSPYGGVPAGQEGMILQRGGEELLLEKRHDRFGVRSGVELKGIQAVTPEWSANLPIAQIETIAPLGLLEVRLREGANLDQVMGQVRSHPQVLYATHVYGLVGDPETLIYIGDEITIAFDATVSSARINSITAAAGLALGSPLRGLSQAYVTQLTPLAQENPVKLANRLMTLPEVLLAEANVLIRRSPYYIPKDTLYPQQWYLHGGSAGSTAGAIQPGAIKSGAIKSSVHIDVEKAWDLTRGERSIVIAITDDGVDLNHPDLQGLGKVVAPKDLRGQDFLPLPDQAQENHGTAVAGVALGEETGRGIVGVAPGCALMPIRTTGYLDDASVENIFQWAVDQGAAVICCSWGAGAVNFPLSLRQRSALTYAATAGRGGKGCVIVFAAGNFNRPVNSTVKEQGWPQNLLSGETRWLNGFAAHPDCLAVSACTSLGKKAIYSNWGNEIFVTAPSSNGIPAIFLDKTGWVPTAPQIRSPVMGLGVLTTDRTGKDGYEIQTAGSDQGDFTGTFGGTSSAAPVVAGVVGLMLSVNPWLTVAEVKDILRQTADKMVDPDPDPQLGLRLGSYERNGHSPWFGYGKVNAYKAVAEAQNRKPRYTLAATPIVLNRALKLAAPLPIPDNDRLVQSISISETGRLGTIEVSLEIDHEFLGDLEIILQPPSSDSSPQNRLNILLQPRTLGRQTHLDTRYSSRNLSALQRLQGRSISGNWSLIIHDRVPHCTGVLKRWQLSLTLF